MQALICIDTKEDQCAEDCSEQILFFFIESTGVHCAKERKDHIIFIRNSQLSIDPSFCTPYSVRYYLACDLMLMVYINFIVIEISC